MNVLLIAPYKSSPVQNREDFIPSTALLCLASALREQGHNPAILDLNTSYVNNQANPEQFCLDLIIAKIEEVQPKLIGFNCLFSGMFPIVLEHSEVVRNRYPDIKIALGGIHATTYPQEILENCPQFDFIALGEGEGQLIELAERIETSNFEGLENIASLAFRNADGSIHINKVQNLLDYDSLPMPAWDMVDFSHYEMDLDHFYSPKGHRIKNIIPIISERGCPYRCNFCDMFVIMGRKLRRKSPTKFVDELEVLNKTYGQQYFSFMDDNLTLDKKHIIAICKEIAKRDLDIQFDTSGGLNINSLDEEIIENMIEAGMVMATIAPEHGSDYIRNEVIGKMLPRERIYEVVEMLRSYKVQIGGGWIMGFPEDTEETLAESYQMMVDLELDRNATGWAIPFPGTKLWEQVVRDDLFIETVDLSSLWQTPIFATQQHFTIKPYALEIEQMEKWRVKFIELRYKFFGKYNNAFTMRPGDDMSHLLPRGAQPA